MQSLTRDEFLGILGVTSGTFDQLQHAGHVALAFGTPLPATPGRYLDLDLVAMAVNLGLAQSLGRKIATTIVAGLFHQWASAVGYAEADPNQDYFMAVGGVGRDAATKGFKLLVVTNGTLDHIKNDFADTKDLVSSFTINISYIIRRLRAKAQAVGIDLSRPFFFPPDDPRFDQILTQVRRERDARIARLRRDKKKFAIAKQHRRPKNITEAPRVGDVTYPPVMQGIFAATSTAAMSAGRI
jgi:hypothetical protein